MPVTLAKTHKPTGPVPVPFFPVIVTTRYTTPDPNTDPTALRIAYASDLQDGDTVIGCAPYATHATADGTADMAIAYSEFFRHGYRVDGHAIDGLGWVCLAKQCFVWRANDLVLYTPAAYS